MFENMTVLNYDFLCIIFFEQMKFELVTVENLAFGKLRFELDTRSRFNGDSGPVFHGLKLSASN
jgi:hypothetical protein